MEQGVCLVKTQDQQGDGNSNNQEYNIQFLYLPEKGRIIVRRILFYEYFPQLNRKRRISVASVQF